MPCGVATTPSEATVGASTGAVTRVTAGATMVIMNKVSALIKNGSETTHKHS